MKNKIIFLIIIMFILHGMKNARQLNDLAIVSAIGIDINEDGEYIITSQILNPKKQNASGSGSSSLKGSSDIVIYNSSSTSIQNAIRNIVEESPRRLYLAHMELLLISEKVARQGDILDTLDYFIRDNEGSNNFMLVITKDTTPQKIMEILTPLETNPAKNIKDSIVATNKYKGTSTDKTLSENLAMFLKEGQGAVLTSIEIVNDEYSLKEENKSESENENRNENKNEEKSDNESENKEKIKVANLGYFKYRSLSGYLSSETSFIYNLLNNSAEAGIIKIGEGDNLLVTEIVKSKTKIRPKVENRKYKVEITINMRCILSEMGKNINLDTKEDVYKYQEEIASKLKSDLEKFINLSINEYECDLMGFGSAYYKYNNKEYIKLKNMYKEEYYKKIKPEIIINVELPNEGGTYNIW